MNYPLSSWSRRRSLRWATTATRLLVGLRRFPDMVQVDQYELLLSQDALAQMPDVLTLLEQERRLSSGHGAGCGSRNRDGNGGADPAPQRAGASQGNAGSKCADRPLRGIEVQRGEGRPGARSIRPRLRPP